MREPLPRCATCIFWARPWSFADGACRRYPPVATHVADRSTWPVTRFDDWCGEHTTEAVSDDGAA